MRATQRIMVEGDPVRGIQLGYRRGVVILTKYCLFLVPPFYPFLSPPLPSLFFPSFPPSFLPANSLPTYIVFGALLSYGNGIYS